MNEVHYEPEICIEYYRVIVHRGRMPFTFIAPLKGRLREDLGGGELFPAYFNVNGQNCPHATDC